MGAPNKVGGSGTPVSVPPRDVKERGKAPATLKTPAPPTPQAIAALNEITRQGPNGHVFAERVTVVAVATRQKFRGLQEAPNARASEARWFTAGFPERIKLVVDGKDVYVRLDRRSASAVQSAGEAPVTIETLGTGNLSVIRGWE